MPRSFIDAHVHLNTLSTEKMETALKNGVKFLSINTDIPFFESLESQEATIHKLQERYPDMIRYATSFDTRYWNTQQWLPHALEQLKRGISNGAVAVKIWKNIGMDAAIADSEGKFVMVDDARFDPLYQYLCDEGILLIGHQGEPRNCWLPLEEMTMNSDQEYFGSHPEYHMYKNADYPSYECQMMARDRVLEKYPDLKYVGLHLFSMEWNLKEVAKRLEKFPNTMTDLAERICHVQFQSMQDRESVREFFITYQDRIIYGSDVIDDGSRSPKALSQRFETLWKNHWKYFETEEEMVAPEFEGTFKGLGLPSEVVQKIFRENAKKTYNF
ncbi:amidohydrolase family protein [Robertkochia solimangrovi]|uniref:amidohydrolase family protein n=1 Tax=Robertkochia solimangrovi TaxID=2213046 RepID=UPI00117FD2A3|nr:amidohydrolase family protein [Robertkochia solimangrovi]TRZ41854.1 hydrolase [Robertkochia solimangrovi]